MINRNQFVVFDNDLYVILEFDDKEAILINNYGNIIYKPLLDIKPIKKDTFNKKINELDTVNFCFLVENGNNGRERSFIGAILPFDDYQHDENDDGDVVLYISLATFREDVKTIFFRSNYLKCIIRTRNMETNSEFTEGISVKFKKKNKYTKEKNIDVKNDVFTFYSVFEKVAMIKRENKIYYTSLDLIKRVKNGDI